MGSGSWFNLFSEHLSQNRNRLEAAMSFQHHGGHFSSHPCKSPATWAYLVCRAPVYIRSSSIALEEYLERVWLYICIKSPVGASTLISYWITTPAKSIFSAAHTEVQTNNSIHDMPNAVVFVCIILPLYVYCLLLASNQFRVFHLLRKISFSHLEHTL